jgi:cytidine deaminase
MNVPIDTLVQAALAARERAYAPYSRFAVGAALFTASGGIISGCNVENASYGLSICAERVAIASAVAAGQRDFVAIAVVTDTAGPASPCGACRQTMVEFNPDLQVILTNLQGALRVTTARELLPGAFTGKDLERQVRNAPGALVG